MCSIRVCERHLEVRWCCPMANSAIFSLNVEPLQLQPSETSQELVKQSLRLRALQQAAAPACVSL